MGKSELERNSFRLFVGLSITIWFNTRKRIFVREQKKFIYYAFSLITRVGTRYIYIQTHTVSVLFGRKKLKKKYFSVFQNNTTKWVYSVRAVH